VLINGPVMNEKPDWKLYRNTDVDLAWLGRSPWLVQVPSYHQHVAFLSTGFSEAVLNPNMLSGLISLHDAPLSYRSLIERRAPELSELPPMVRDELVLLASYKLFDDIFIFKFRGYDSWQAVGTRSWVTSDGQSGYQAVTRIARWGVVVYDQTLTGMRPLEEDQPAEGLWVGPARPQRVMPAPVIGVVPREVAPSVRATTRPPTTGSHAAARERGRAHWRLVLWLLIVVGTLLAVGTAVVLWQIWRYHH